MSKKEEKATANSHIIIKGANVHNLKNISIAIPRDKIVVVTGLSGSGKSSLVFDTLFAEGQRRYVESLSSYARQFLGKLEKPDVEYINGIAPAIAIEQKVNTVNKRSTVGTSTEVYDYLKLLFARIGKTYSPISGKQVMQHTITDVVEYILAQKEGSKFALLVNREEKDVLATFQLLLQQGFTRVIVNKKIERIEALITDKKPPKSFALLVDRFIVNTKEEDFKTHLFDSIETAFFEGKGTCIVAKMEGKEISDEKHFSNKFELDGINFQEPSTHFFSFNNPAGACHSCEGHGSVIGIDKDLVIPNKNLSIYENAIVCWRGEVMQKWKNDLIMHAEKFSFPIHKPIYDLTDKQKEVLWTGNKYFEGLNQFFKFLERESYKIQYRVMLSRYRGKTECLECQGSRLRKDANYVKVAEKSVTELVLMPLTELEIFFKEITLSDYDQEVARRILIEIRGRLHTLNNVGLGYLTLNRLSSTLSGGESQRINLATSLGSSLVGSMYILDEPSIGLHPRDTERLISVLQSLNDLGNTIIIVEHDDDIIKMADEIIDMGPFAGFNGGEVIFHGTYEALLKHPKSITAQYFNKTQEIAIPQHRRRFNKEIKLLGAQENNLKNLNVRFPLEVLTVITGVSGSGKSSLVKNCLLPSLTKKLDSYASSSEDMNGVTGDVNSLSGIEFINQNPIGKSSRSNPVTYIKAYDDIRALYSEQPLSRTRKYKPSYFSFNVEGGRCEECKGEGEIVIEMQFMADVHLQCEECKGKKFTKEVLEVKYREKTIADILLLTIDEAIAFFMESKTNIEKKIVSKLRSLQNVGLGYVTLGQSSNTLSGGEAQRIKLASFIIKKDQSNKILFIFDEPTTGLHIHDIKKLLKSFDALLEKGHSIIVIEHNLDVIKTADWVIDLGPDGGKNGGSLIFEGTPEDLIKNKASYTAQYLKDKM